MLNSPFHRSIAEIKDGREQLDRLLRLSAPHESLLLVAIALVILAFVAWLLFGSVARSVTVGCLLIEPGERRVAVSVEPGRLLEFLVAPNERVEAGQMIARQSVPELEREMDVLRDRLNLLQAELGRAGVDLPNPLLIPASEALLRIEAQRTVRESIVSQSAGEVIALKSAPGAYLSAGTAVALIRAAGDVPVGAVLRIDRDVARRVRPGMQAEVEVPASDGGTRRLEGEVANVSAGPLPNWLARMEPAVPASTYRVDVALRPDSGLPDGTACLARIELGKHAPVALLTADGPE